MAIPANVDKKLFKELAEVLKANELTEIEYDTDTFRIRMAKHAPVSAGVMMAAPQYAPVPATAAAAAVTPQGEVKADKEEDWENHAGAVKSPMVGVIYSAQDPNTPPFIREGDKVTEGQTLFLIEAMKTFNPVKAPKAGKVLKILVSNSQPVEYDEPLAVIG